MLRVQMDEGIATLTLTRPAKLNSLAPELVCRLADAWEQLAADPAVRVVLVTGAAGAIGSGICEGLLADGAHVVATDLPGEGLDSLTAALDAAAPGRAFGVPLDVSDPASVADAFAAVLAQELNATLVTSDPEFHAVQHLLHIEWLSEKTSERESE